MGGTDDGIQIPDGRSILIERGISKMAQSPEQMAQSTIANMPAKTGKSLDEWLKIVSKTKLGKHGEIVKLLKSDHGVTHGFYENLLDVG